MTREPWFRILAISLLHLLGTGAQATNSTIIPGVQLRQCDDVRCNCTFTSNGFWNATCQLDGSFQLPTPFILFETLDISKNDLEIVPTTFLWNQGQLTTLSLAYNRISVIKDCDFGKLPNLTSLDLSFNPLKTWTGDVKTNLPNLLNLFVDGTKWIPQENVLTIPSLEFVYGVSWSNACSNCYLYNWAKANGPPDYTPEEKGKEQAIKFAKIGFLPFSCGNGSVRIQLKCQPSFPKDRNLEGKRQTTIVPQKLFYGSYVMGAVAIILNFIILVTVFSARSLRNSTSMLLISNMAFCDLLMGIYSVIIGDLNIFNFISNAYTTGAKLFFERKDLCGFSTVIFTSAQCVAAATSLLLTVEKYLSIVHCMDPNRRLSKKVAFISVILLWVLSLLYGISPIFGVFGLSMSVPLMCSFPIASDANTFLIFPSVLIALYLINIPLYVAIFISVRKSGADLGIKRETAILKKIALVVVTNFLLLLTPFILIITLVPTKNIHKSLELDGSKSTQMLLIFGFWFPIACLGFNSCINPILCAFRQGQFVRQIRKVLGCFSVPGHIQAAFVSRSSERTQPTSELDTSSSQVVLHSITSFNK